MKITYRCNLSSYIIRLISSTFDYYSETKTGFGFEARAQLAHPLFILFDTSLRVKKLPVD